MPQPMSTVTIRIQPAGEPASGPTHEQAQPAAKPIGYANGRSRVSLAIVRACALGCTPIVTGCVTDGEDLGFAIGIAFWTVIGLVVTYAAVQLFRERARANSRWEDWP